MIDNTIGERIKQLITHFLDGNNSKFAEIVGTNEANIRNYIKGTQPKFDVISAIAQKFDISYEWLLTGRGDMLKTKDPSDKETSNIFNVKLVSQYAYGGYFNGFADEEYLETLPTIPFIIPDGQTTRGLYMAFEVRGDSMDDESKDSILSGDIALGRFIHPDLYTNSQLHYKKWSTFILVHTTEGIIIKQITDHNLESKTLTIHSLNPLFEDKIISLKEVSQIFNVVQLLRNKR